jgi:hypothetical protein
MRQIQTRCVTTQWIMRSAAFVAGVDDVRSVDADQDRRQAEPAVWNRRSRIKSSSSD